MTVRHAMHEFSPVPARHRATACGSAIQTDPIETTAILERVTRIEALLRELIGTRDTLRRVGCLELDLIERSAKRGERSIELLPREFRLLEYMMRRSNQLLTRAMLLAEVWNYKFVPATNLLDVHIGRLRRKVDAPNEFPMIQNVRGAGFICGHRRFTCQKLAISRPVKSVLA
jgi:DNA-binding response OmpR family regulator